MFYEVRRYQTRPSQREVLVRYMDDVVIPYMSAHGMSVIASFTDEQDPDAYVWIRRFDDEAHREAAYAAVYESHRWIDDMAPVVGPLLDTEGTTITRVTPTSRSRVL